jgi:hypothetical protein
MTIRTRQNFENHGVVPRPWLIAALLVLAGVVSAAVGLAMLGTTTGLNLIGFAVVLIGLGSLMGLGLVRRYATKLQDRIIRIEMRVRLAQILQPEQRQRVEELTIKQLVGLRFASDAELPGLLETVLSDNIQDSKAIKRLVKDWQADDCRV